MDKDTFKKDDALGAILLDISSLYNAGMLVDKEEMKMDLRLENTSRGTVQFSLVLDLLL